MSNKVGTYTLIERIVDLMDTTVYIDSVSNVSTTYTILSSNTKWITLGYTVTIDGTDFVVTSVTPNVSFTVESNSAITATEFNLLKPNFFNGTAIMASSEISRIQDNFDRVPFIFFHEPSTDSFYYDILDARDRDSQCDLYFMTQSNFADYTNEQHHINAVRACGNMVDSFVLAMLNCSFIGELNNFDSEDQVKWGTINQNGHILKIFTDDLSGKKIGINIPFLKEDCCECEPYSNPFDVDYTVVFNGNTIETGSINLLSDNEIIINFE